MQKLAIGELPLFVAALSCLIAAPKRLLNLHERACLDMCSLALAEVFRAGSDDINTE